MGEGARRVLVTGGARGMGEAIVRRLAGAGFAVEFTYSSSAERAEALANELGAKAHHCDLSDKAAVEALAAELAGGDAFYGLVHNAGVSYDTLSMMVDQAQGERLMQVNFWAMLRLVKALTRGMMQKRTGRIVAIGSITATRASQGNAVYAASKGAIASFLNTLAVEVAKRGITVNTIAPGYVDTDMMTPYAAYREKIEKQVPAQRFARSDEIAAAVAYLMSDDAAYVSGSTLTIDGALSAAIAIQR